MTPHTVKPVLRGHSKIDKTKSCHLQLCMSFNINTVQSLYNTPCFNMDLDITRSCCVSKIVLPLHFTKELWKMTIKWLLCKIVPLNHDSLITHSIPMDPKYSVIKAWVKVFRIIPEFRILRLTFHRKSASKS